MSLTVWLALCKIHYESYWFGTIRKVQTVDFNLLHHTLPPALSYLILCGREDSIQEVLDSSYGMFGLVITDPSGQEILYKTSQIYKKLSWHQALTPDTLAQAQEPYDLLTDPPPQTSQFKYPSAKLEKIDRHPSEKRGRERILGRVYYLRGIPPSFFNDLAGSVFSNWLEMSGSKRGYIVISLSMLLSGLGGLFLMFWYRRELQIRVHRLTETERKLDQKKKSLDDMTATMAAQMQRKELLEQEAEVAYNKSLGLKKRIIQLRSILIRDNPYRQGEDLTKRMEFGPDVRPPMHQTSNLLTEMESVVTELSQGARVLLSQAEVWQTYCEQLEKRNAELSKYKERQEQLNFVPDNNELISHKNLKI